MNTILSIHPKEETEKIVSFLKKTFQKQGIANAVIALSGGIDSTTSFYLLKLAIPPKHIYVTYLPYFSSHSPLLQKLMAEANIPNSNFFDLPINQVVAAHKQALHVEDKDSVRLGNIMARTRMIFTYDIAKKLNALVCGTENKSEHLLGYFTRFGDEASDVEPILHLYKTQVYELAKYLGVPQEIIDQKPTAGLWHGQTDEEEFGFSYKEADWVLYYFFEQKLSIEEITAKGFSNARKVIKRAKDNQYKHKTPYFL